ncbi:class I SAM-dependent methyltransferase [Roseibacterium sp. SDUM158017]|uniref:class I SAM-dependent methyltransferase n=1 Tax=Roseicyclus salinarum TaxID=3036773 RepID=UPI0024157CBD|nr:class I SAM-dependent methyltransferase [Roseibacterium sp. SDUM158017]MDG4647633.1 class I SAM-dependent methyltransferase [Roseibacterium sp. SDUM158017]
MDRFLRFHEGVSRQGPGTPDDVSWAVKAAGTKAGARVLDAGAGVGEDIRALREAIPEARVVALEAHEGFVEAISGRYGPEVTAIHGSMGPQPGFDGSAPVDLAENGPFDLIWSAGAIYFVGVGTALEHWKGALAEGGAAAFTAPVFFTDTPSEEAVAFWQGDKVDTVGALRDAVAGAGYRILAERREPDAGWEAYFAAQAVRIATLREDILQGREDAAMAEILDQAEHEAEAWRKLKDEVGYHAVVAAPA